MLTFISLSTPFHYVLTSHFFLPKLIVEEGREGGVRRNYKDETVWKILGGSFSSLRTAFIMYFPLFNFLFFMCRSSSSLYQGINLSIHPPISNLVHLNTLISPPS